MEGKALTDLYIRLCRNLSGQDTNPQGRQFNFQYDANGRRTKLIYPNGIEAIYAYDAGGQALGITHKRTNDDIIIAQSTYDYDDAGNHASMTDLSGTHSFQYDDRHQLTQAIHPIASSLPVTTENFSYDPTGNRLADAEIGGYTYNTANRLIENSSFTYTFDADGNLSSKTDKATNQTTSYIYDSENHLVGLELPGGENWTYRYDSLERRIEKSSGTANNQRILFAYDKMNPISILDGAGNHSRVFTSSIKIDEFFSLRNSSNADYFLHSGYLGSIIAHSDLAGNPIERIQYGAYGLPLYLDIRSGSSLSATSSFTGNPYGFTGREFDNESNIYNYRKRYYSAVEGRFLSEDPISIKPEESNLYLYVSNNPQKYSDPLGLLRDDPGQVLYFAGEVPFCTSPDYERCSAYDQGAAARSGFDRDMAKSFARICRAVKPGTVRNCIRRCLAELYPPPGAGFIPVVSTLNYLFPQHGYCFAICGITDGAIK